MVEKRDKKAAARSKRGFSISEGPVVRLADEDQLIAFDDVVGLPRAYGSPILFAIGRDPRTIFTYWNVDWPTVFAKADPVDRKVHLRVCKCDGVPETSAAVEPMAGNCYLTLSQSGGAYRVEIGYYQPAEHWNSVATSDVVTMPPEDVAQNVDIDLATIPFHLSFQRLIDLFRASNPGALAEIISRLQKRAVSDEERELLSTEEWEILRAMNLSIDEIRFGRRPFLKRGSEALLRTRAQAILGFGATSPSRAFGQSSSPAGPFGPSGW